MGVAVTSGLRASPTLASATRGAIPAFPEDSSYTPLGQEFTCATDLKSQRLPALSALEKSLRQGKYSWLGYLLGMIEGKKEKNRSKCK